MKNKILDRLKLGVLLFTGVIFGSTQAYAADTIQSGSAIIEQAGLNNSFTYYTVRRDFRKCISPLCGGFFVSKVNHRKTQCADGTLRNECYVADIDWAGSRLSEKQTSALEGMKGVLLRGEIGRFKTNDFGVLGEFLASEAWTAATENAAKGVFVRLSNSGIVCVTTPCDTIREDILNKKRSRNLPEVDLSGVGASDEQIREAFNQIAAPRESILAAGKHQSKDMRGRTVTTFVASQFYFRVKPEPVVSEANLVGKVTLSPTCGGAIREGQVCVQPYVGAMVEVLDINNNLHGRAITNENGIFSVNMTPGDYVLHIEDKYFIDPPIPLPKPLPQPAPVDQVMSIGQAVTVDMEASSSEDSVSIYYPVYPICPDTPVTVPKIGGVKVSIDCDTGIR